jgi:hypothetical protein
VGAEDRVDPGDQVADGDVVDPAVRDLAVVADAVRLAGGDGEDEGAGCRVLVVDDAEEAGDLGIEVAEAVREDPVQAVGDGLPGQYRSGWQQPGWCVRLRKTGVDQQEPTVLLDQRGGREVSEAVAVAAGDQFADVVEIPGAGHGVRRSGTMSVRWWGIVGRAASGVASSATIVTGC